MGFGHYIPADAERNLVLGDLHGSGQPENLGVGDRYEDDNGVHLEGPGHGCADTQAGETFCGRHDCALGSRFAVLLSEVSGTLGSAEHAPVDEPVGELLGQRAQRVDLELAKARGAHWLKRFAGHEAAVTAVAHWIHVYNYVRPHSSIAMRTPLEYEEDLATSKSVKPSA